MVITPISADDSRPTRLGRKKPADDSVTGVSAPTHILLIEDAEEFADLVRTYAEATWPDAIVDVAHAGLPALLQVRRNAPDLIVLDLGLPDVDGLDLLRALRSESRVPVIVMSARTNSETRIAALRSGADDFIPKPVDLPELIARIEAVLRRGHKSPALEIDWRLLFAGVVAAVITAAIAIWAVGFDRAAQGSDALDAFSVQPAAITAPIATNEPLTGNFEFPDFREPSRISTVGSARVSQGVAILTPSETQIAGAIWFTNRVLITNGFTNRFDFRISSPTSSGGDGFAFVIQNHSMSAIAGSVGPSLGYGGVDGSGIPNCLAIEFDTWQNGLIGDPPAGHISVHSSGRLPNDISARASLAVAPGKTDYDDGEVHSATVRYDGSTLKMYLDNSLTPLLSLEIDLVEMIGSDDGGAWVGFTASTGGATAAHEILNWSFESSASSDG